MTLYGFLATIIICGATVGIVTMLCKWGIIIHHTHKDITEKPAPIEISQMNFTSEKSEKPAPDKAVEVTSMDAVIKAANELMGIETITKENDNDR